VPNALTPIRRVSQIRQYRGEDVPDEVVAKLLELARWTGSSRNTQPWQFVVVRDKQKLASLAAMRPNINWAAKAPVGIVIVLDGEGVSEAYDEGRLTERVLTGATLLGYGGGVAWFGEAEHQAKAKQILGIPAEKTARQMIMIGRPLTNDDPRPYGPKRGRKPMDELVSYESWGKRRAE
jgi:nitroreductase